MLKIPKKQPETTVFTTNFLHSRIRLHLSISFFSAKCNLNRGNLIGPRTVKHKERKNSLESKLHYDVMFYNRTCLNSESVLEIEILPTNH